MFKQLAVIFLLIGVIFSAQSVEAKAKKKKGARSSKVAKYKPSKHKRKSRSYRQSSNGPDLKTITTESPYKEDPTNGVTPVETKQPAL